MCKKKFRFRFRGYRRHSYPPIFNFAVIFKRKFLCISKRKILTNIEFAKQCLVCKCYRIWCKLLLRRRKTKLNSCGNETTIKLRNKRSSLRSEHLDPMIFALADDDVSGGSDGNALEALKFAVAAAPVAKSSEENSFGRENLYAVVP